jgi:hypothetical protein
MRIRMENAMGRVLRSIRAIGGRLLVVAVLAIVMTTGFVAVDHPSGASAAPKLNCLESMQVGQAWQVYGDLMAAYGYTSQARLAYVIANNYFAACDGGPA